MVSTPPPPRSTLYLSYEAFAGLKYYTPFCAQDFHLGGCENWSSPAYLIRFV